MLKSHLRTLAWTVAAALALVAPATQGSAQSSVELLQEIQMLKERLQTLEAAVAKNQQEAAIAKQEAATAKQEAVAAKEAVETTDSGVEWKWGPPPTVRTKDGRFSAQVRGRLFADYNYITGEADQQTNDAELRDARLGIEGVAWKDFKYKFEVDFAGNDVDIKDATISYKGLLAPAEVTIGQFKTPNSLDELTSSSFTTFMERAALADAFNLDRRMGAGADVGGSNWSISGGGFWQNTGTATVANNGPDMFGALAARGHYAFDLGENDAVHLGTSVRWRNCNNDGDSSSACTNNTVRYRQRPFFHGTDVRHVDTGTIDGMNSDIWWGPEFALVYGPFSLQSEAAFVWGSRQSSVGGTPTGGSFGPLWSTYLDASYFLTGEQRNYSKSKGTFGRVKVKNPLPDGGWGAFQVAGRFDYISLEDADNGIEGGEQYTVVGGLNWYMNDNVRAMLDLAYTHVTNGPTSVNTASGNNNIFGVGLRGQVDW